MSKDNSRAVFVKNIFMEKIIAFTSYDGFFKIYGFESCNPILIIKSDFGCYNCF